MSSKNTCIEVNLLLHVSKSLRKHVDIPKEGKS